jgi:Phage-related minor tail protein/Phage tail lysozyme
MIVGEAEVVIIPNSEGFAAAMDAETQGAFGNLRKDAEVAGEDAGANLRGGVTGEASKLEKDLNDIGAAGGVNLRDGVTKGTKGLEGDLADVGGLAGGNLRSGVREHTDKLADDFDEAGRDSGSAYSRALDAELAARLEEMDDEGEKAGGRLSKGIGSGMSKLANLISNMGLPLGGFSTKLEEAGKAAEDTSGKASGLTGTLSHLGGYALLGVAGAAGVAAVAGVKLAESMQTADASIEGSADISTAAAKAIGDAFLGTAFKSTFSGQEMAKAYAAVAGQLKSTEGHALSTSEAMQVMGASSDLAEAKQIGLGSATETVAKTMQVFGLGAGEAAHASDVLYSASNATNQSVESFAQQLSKMKSKLGETSGSIGQLSGLIVDMTDQHLTGRAAVTGLTAGLNTLEKSAEATGIATRQQKSAFDAMGPSLQALAKQYENGSITSKDFKKETEGLSPPQATLVASFTKASTAVQAAQAKYKEMGVTAFDAQGKFVGMGSIIDQLNPKFAKMSKEQQFAASTTLFGATAAKQMTAIIDAGPAAYNKATASVEKHGAAEAAAKKQGETLKGETEKLEKGVIGLATRYGEMLIPVVTKLAKALADTAVFVLQHKAAMIALAVVIGGPVTVAIAAYVATLIGAAASSAGAFATIAAGGELAEGATLGATASMAAGWIATAGEAITSAAAQVGAWVSVGAAATAAFVAENVATLGIVAGIAALVAGIIFLATHWHEAWDDIKAVVADAVGFIEGHWKLILPILLGPFGLLIDGIATFHAQIIGFFTQIVDFIIGVWTKVKTTATELITSLVTYFAQLPGRVFGFFTSIVNWIVTTWTHAKAVTLELVNSVVSFFSQLPGRIAGFFTTIANDIVRVWDTVKAGVQILIGGIVNYFKELPGRITSGISGLAGDVAKVWSEVSKGASSLIGEVVGFFESLPGKIMAAVEKLPGDFLNMGKSVIEGFIHGVESAAGGLLGALKHAVLGPVEGLAHELGIESPSKVTEKHGESIVEGYVAGMAKAAPKAKTAALGIAQEIMRTIEAAGLSKVAAAGFVGNAAQESSLNPGEPGGGLYQMSGYPAADSAGGAQQQTKKALELMGASVAAQMNKATTPGEAATIMMREWEKPEGSQPGEESRAGVANLPHRERAAVEAYGQYGGAPVASRSAASSAEQKAALDKEVAAQERAFKDWAARTTAVAADGTKAQKAAAAQEIAERKAMLAQEVAGEKAGLTVQQAQQKVALAKQTTDQKAGTSALNKMLEAIHSGSLKTLSSVLEKVHLAGLSRVEKDLDSDHKAALAKLSGELIEVWKRAEAKRGALEHKEAEAAADNHNKEEEAALAARQKTNEENEKAYIDAINKQTQVNSDIAANATQEIADATKVTLDRQVEAGLSGTAEIAARLQTVLDEVTQQGDKEIGAAKLAEDQAAGTGAIAEAEAQARVAQIENAAHLRDAKAQSEEEIAAKNTSTTTTNNSVSQPLIFNFNGPDYSVQNAITEMSWAFKIGAIPPPVMPS